MNGWPYFAYSLCVGVLKKGKGYKIHKHTKSTSPILFYSTILFTDFMFMFKFKSLALCFYTVKTHNQPTNQQTKNGFVHFNNTQHFIIRS